MRLKLASRRSDLAKIQAYMVGGRIRSKHPEVEIEYLFKESLGDINLTDPLWKAPEKGLFTEDFYEDLVQGRADLVVHSWKDLPILDKPKTYIAATLERADARDVLLFKNSSKKKSHLKILSSSPRRIYNLTPFFQWSLPWTVDSLDMESVRGNIPTRIRKLNEGEADGLIVAKAALDRMHHLLSTSLQDLDFQVIPHSANPPCAGQGALAIEIARDNKKVAEILSAIHCSQTFAEVEEERSILKEFGGGCHQKIGVWIHQKPYGKIQILRGLTDQGEVLNRAGVQHAAPPRRPKTHMISAEDSAPLRRRALSVNDPLNNGLIVSRFEALPQDWSTEGRLIWSAGTQTWNKLAKSGVWVHGTFDGLGEDKIELPFLKQQPNWLKLTHSRGSEQSYPHLATYEVSNPVLKGVDSQNFYFWRSLTQFEAALKAFPEIVQAHHACGPGATYHSLQKRLNTDRVFAFLNETDWRRQCQI